MRRWPLLMVYLVVQPADSEPVDSLAFIPDLPLFMALSVSFSVLFSSSGYEHFHFWAW